MSARSQVPRQTQNSTVETDSSSLPSAIPSSFGEETRKTRSYTAEETGQQMLSTNTPSAPKRGAGSKHKGMFILIIMVFLASSSTTPTMNWLTSLGALIGSNRIPQIISQLFLQTGNSLESTSLESKFCHGCILAVGPSTEIPISRLDN